MQDLKFQLMVGALERARFGLCVVDSNGRILLANKAFLSKLGTTEEEVLGMSFLVLQRFLGRHELFFQLFRIQDPEISAEFKVPTAGRPTRYLLLQSSNMTHSSGEIFRTISVLDVSDYGASRDKFVELRRQVEAMNSSVVIVDAQAADLPICFVNAHFERMTGYSAKEALGRNCRFLQGNDTGQEGLVQLRTALKNRQNCRVVLMNYRKDGTKFHNELYVSPAFDESGTLTHFVGVQNEVSPPGART